MNATRAALVLAFPLAVGCGSPAVIGGGDGGGMPVAGCDPDAPPTRFASCVLSFEPGEGAGHGQDAFPDIVYGPPKGAGTSMGSLDTLSLGRGGEIAFGFGGNAIVDGPGPDFLIFENAFYIAGNPDAVFAEPGEVSVSEDGVSWTTFPCASQGYPYTGCAGWHPVLASADNGVSPFDPTAAGGDAFDLADVGLTRARYVRIRDVSMAGAAPTAGFDLDAAAIVHAESM
jgi:hypothetical protein